MRSGVNAGATRANAIPAGRYECGLAAGNHWGDRPAVADQDDLTEPEFVAYYRDDFPERVTA